MAKDDIEKFLLAKLNEVVDELDKEAAHKFSARVFLSSRFKTLKQTLEDHQSRTTTVPDLREKLYTLENLLSEWQMHVKKKKHTCSYKPLSFAYNYKQKLEKIIEELKVDGTITTQIIPETEEEEDDGYRWSDRLVDEEKVYGIKDKALSLQKSLVLQNDNNDRRFSMIGIFGMRGVGKTTLAQVVFNKTEVKKHFLPRIWVCVSKQPGDDDDPRIEIVKRMLMSLGVEETIIESAKSKHGLKGLLFALRLQLTGKRYLIVLDDVWSKEAKYEDFSGFCSSLEQDENKCSEKLAYGLPKGYGGAVIVTSRSEEFVKKMVGEENLHRVLPLKDPESSWNIFMDSVGENYTPLEGLKEKIIDKCAGLPLAARMMGQIAHESDQKKAAAVPEDTVPENLQKSTAVPENLQKPDPVHENAPVPENLQNPAPVPENTVPENLQKPAAVPEDTVPENLQKSATVPENLQKPAPVHENAPVLENTVPENLQNPAPVPENTVPENLQKPAPVLENLQKPAPVAENAPVPENTDPENLQSDQQTNGFNGQHSGS